jgi:dipeptide/tripeptide permease
VGPYVGGWLQDLAGGSFLTTSFFLGACLIAAGLVALTLRRRGDRPALEVEASRERAAERVPH